jgi:hypothetical protein
MVMLCDVVCEGGRFFVSEIYTRKKMQESPVNNLLTEDSICLFVFDVLL